MEAKQRIAVIGAGPIGLEAALYGLQAGYDVQVYERGGIADNMRDWGHVRLFSPFGLNASDWGRASLVAVQKNRPLPGNQELLTGREYVERYLIPLAQLPALTGRIHEQAHVLAVGRTLYEELQVEESSVTEGTTQRSSLSLRESSADALTRTSGGFETLRTSEPGFFILGAKSYGRDSHFLMKTGLEQIQDLFQGLTHQGAARRAT